jgi:hypothetical protein
MNRINIRRNINNKGIYVMRNSDELRNGAVATHTHTHTHTHSPSMLGSLLREGKTEAIKAAR